jgi:predicted alpha/beta-hydrolase family hydrolase
VVDPSARFEELKIPLREPAHGLAELSGVLGVPEWWPTGARVAIVLAHGSTGTLNDPILEYVHRELAERRYLTLRFNFPFAETGKRASSDSPAVLEEALRCAIAALGKDPAHAPAHLFLGGMGLGARTISRLAAGRLRADGLFFLGYPLHPQDKQDEVQPEDLYRIITPMLFAQGTRDRTCDLGKLRSTLTRVGAPTLLHVVEDGDRDFKVTKKSGIDEAATHARILQTIATWIEQILGGSA